MATPRARRTSHGNVSREQFARSPSRDVGVVLVDVKDDSDDDRSHFIAEMAEESYEKCGLRPFTGPGHVGGFEHVRGDGDTADQAIDDLGRVLAGMGLKGTLRVRKVGGYWPRSGDARTRRPAKRSSRRAARRTRRRK